MPAKTGRPHAPHGDVMCGAYDRHGEAAGAATFPRAPRPASLSAVLTRLVEKLAVQLEVGLVVLGVVRRELELRLFEPLRFLGLGLFVALHRSLSVVSRVPTRR